MHTLLCVIFHLTWRPQDEGTTQARCCQTLQVKVWSTLLRNLLSTQKQRHPRMDLRKHKARKPSWGVGWSTKRRKPEECPFKAKELVADGEGKATLNTQGSHEGVTLNEQPSPPSKSDTSAGSNTASSGTSHPLTLSPLAFQLGLGVL